MIKHLEICTYEQIKCPHCKELFASAKVIINLQPVEDSSAF